MLRCRESGSTLRFMIPPALTGGRVRFEGTPRLLERGVGIYEQLLGDKGIEIKKDSGGIEFFGALTAGEYVLRGDVSSQFITGLLFALPLLSGRQRDKDPSAGREQSVYRHYRRGARLVRHKNRRA